MRLLGLAALLLAAPAHAVLIQVDLTGTVPVEAPWTGPYERPDAITMSLLLDTGQAVTEVQLFQDDLGRTCVGQITSQLNVQFLHVTFDGEHVLGPISGLGNYFGENAGRRCPYDGGQGRLGGFRLQADGISLGITIDSRHAVTLEEVLSGDALAVLLLSSTAYGAVFSFTTDWGRGAGLFDEPRYHQVPEPAAFALMALALGMFAVRRRTH